jgi:hypothetical protein
MTCRRIERVCCNSWCPCLNEIWRDIVIRLTFCETSLRRNRFDKKSKQPTTRPRIERGSTIFRIPLPPNQMWMHPALQILIRIFEIWTASPNFDCPVKKTYRYWRQKKNWTHRENWAVISELERCNFPDLQPERRTPVDAIPLITMCDSMCKGVDCSTSAGRVISTAASGSCPIEGL